MKNKILTAVPNERTDIWVRRVERNTRGKKAFTASMENKCISTAEEFLTSIIVHRCFRAKRLETYKYKHHHYHERY
jgi:hypothetical protein